MSVNETNELLTSHQANPYSMAKLTEAAKSIQISICLFRYYLDIIKRLTYVVTLPS